MNLDRVVNWNFEDVEQHYSDRDTMLYALSLGFGSDPLNSRELRFVYERNLIALPSMGLTLSHPGPWAADPLTGIDIARVVFAEQSLEIFRPLPTAGTAIGRERVLGVVDKGSDAGALVYTERTLRESGADAPLLRLVSALMCRGNGGCGSSGFTPPERPAPPRRSPEISSRLETLEQQALIYRLNGDRNPLHVDPVLAAKAGFDKPILHGLCTYGVALRGLLRDWCDYDVSRIRSMTARFSAPVFPGEALILESWGEGDRLWFTLASENRGVMVLKGGCVDLTPAGIG